MQTYLNKGSNSGIIAYDIRPQSIIVKFQDQWCYEYSIQSAGAAHLKQMIMLAQRGEGLNAYINQNVKYDYARKFRG